MRPFTRHGVCKPVFRVRYPGVVMRLGHAAAFAVVAFLLGAALASPALARVAAIETSAPLADHSDEAIKAAITQAVVSAVRGAMAMGLPWVQVRQATVLGELVTVQIVASDVEPEEDEAESDPDRPTQPARIDL
jgi:hypothetical protein